MNTKSSLKWAAVAACLISGAAQATLIPALNGQVLNDTDRNITWLADFNLAATNTFGVSGISPAGRMDWHTAQAWISAMNTANYLGFNDWRLPTTLQPDPTCGSQATDTAKEYTCTGSEMGHLYYEELGGIRYLGIADYGMFINVPSVYWAWSGTESATNTDRAWMFGFSYGNQGTVLKQGSGDSSLYALAVRSGQVAANSIENTVPEPQTLALLALGLAGLGIVRRKVRPATAM